MISRKPWLALALGLLLTVGLLLALLPWLARIALVDILQDSLQGAATIEAVDIDLRHGVVAITALQASDNAALSLRSGSVRADIGLRALLHGDIIGEIELIDALVDYGDLVIKLQRLNFDGTLVAAGTEEEPEWLVQGDLAIDALGLFDRVQQITLLSLGQARVSEAVFNTATMALRVPSLKLDQIGVMKADVENARWLYGEEIEISELRYDREQLTIQVHATRLEYGDLVTRFESVRFDGAVHNAGSDAAADWQVQGDLAIDALGLFDRTRQITLLSLGALRASQAKVTSAELTIDIPSLKLSRIGAVNTGSDDSRWLYGEDLSIDQLHFADKLLQIQAIEGSGLRSVVQLTAAGELESQGVLSASLAALAGEESVAGEEEEAATLQFAIARLVARNSELHFADLQFARPLTVDLLVDEISLTDLDSRQPQQASTIVLKSRVGEYSRIDLAGSFAPFAEQLAMDIQGNIKALPLPLVSPYIEPLLGYELSAGQFDHSFDIKIADETLDASNQIELRKVKVKKLKDVEPSAPLGIPLDTGLNMLRDKQGHISLDIPLQGRLDDPDIGLNQVVSKALSKALTQSSTAFLKFALQPYGAIWTGAEMGLKMATKVRLDPMQFAPLSEQLQGEPQGYAVKLAELLNERPGMDLTLCGVSGAGDHAALQQLDPEAAAKKDLVALAQARSDALKSYLVNDKKIAAERLYVCKPEVDPQAKVSGIKLEI